VHRRESKGATCWKLTARRAVGLDLEARAKTTERKGMGIYRMRLHPGRCLSEAEKVLTGVVQSRPGERLSKFPWRLLLRQHSSIFERYVSNSRGVLRSSGLN